MNPTDTGRKSLTERLNEIKKNASNALFRYRQTGTGLRLANIAETDVPALVKAVRRATDIACSTKQKLQDERTMSDLLAGALLGEYPRDAALLRYADSLACESTAAAIRQQATNPAPSPIPAAKVEEKKDSGLKEEPSDRVKAVLQKALKALEPLQRLANVFDIEPYSKEYPDNCRLNGDYLPQKIADTISEHNWLTLGHCRRAKSAFNDLERLLSEAGPKSDSGEGKQKALSVWMSEAGEELVIDLEFGGELDFTNEPVNTRDTVIRNFARIIAKHEPPSAPCPKCAETKAKKGNRANES